jgi:hypothetical protein
VFLFVIGAINVLMMMMNDENIGLAVETAFLCGLQAEI